MHDVNLKKRRNNEITGNKDYECHANTFQPAFTCSNNGKTRTMCEFCSKLTVKTPDRRQLKALAN